MIKPRDITIVLSGDFNQPNIDWENSTLAPGNSASKDTAELLLSAVTGFGLNQYVKEPTRRGNILDVVFTNINSLIQDIKVEPGMSDHDSVIVDLDLKPKWKRQPKRTYFERQKADEEQINEELEDLQECYFSMKGATVQDKWDTFEEGIST